MKRLKKDVLEEYVLLASVLKWIILAAIIGLVVGGATSLFIKIVTVTSTITYSYKYYYMLMPLAFFLSSYIVVRLAPDAKGHGTEKAIQAVNQNAGKMDIKVVPVKIVTTIITIMFGGSVGLEGPSTQIGAGIASQIGKIFKFNDMDRKRLAVCGIGAGFVGVFGAPVGAAIFASEVLYIGQFSYITLFPSLVASFVSFFVGRTLGTKPLINYFIDMKQFSTEIMFLRMVLFGVIIGVLAMAFIRIVNFVENMFKKIKVFAPIKGLIGGGIVVLIVLITGTTVCLGIGEETIQNIITGESKYSFAWFWKTLTTSITLGCGGSGGILTPMLYIGASCGSTWANIINGSQSFYAAVGMVSFMSACANTPLAGIVMCMEFFGGDIGMYAAIVCVISYLIVGHKSIYPTQILIRAKTNSLGMSTNCEVGSTDKKIQVKNNTLNKFMKG